MRRASWALGRCASWALGLGVSAALGCGAGEVETTTDGGKKVEPTVETSGVRPPPAANAGCTQVVPGQAGSRLLTRAQYDNTVRDLLGSAVALGATFPRESTLLGFSNNASVHRVSLLLAENHLQAAETLAQEVVTRGLSALLPCATRDRACVEQFVSSFGLRAYRRPLQAAEAAGLMSLYDAAAGQWGFESGVQLVLQAFLQAPQFLYRNEGEASAATQGLVALDSYTVASRLSYFLWNTMPDAELFQLAGQGALQDRTAVEAQARRMLADPRAHDAVTDFYTQWFGVADFDGLVRQGQGVESSAAYGASWRQSLLDFAEHTFWTQGGTVESLFTSSAVFLDPPLAALYELPTVDGPVSDRNRMGLLAQPGLLALLSHPDQSAPVQRGLFVRERLLCQELPPPPPDVDASPPDPSPNATTRERFKEHSANGRCASCHRLLDPLGFGFEQFDQLGRYRIEENGVPIDASGEVIGVTDPALMGPFNGLGELSVRLSTSTQVSDCLATQWFRFAMGRAEQVEDDCSLTRARATLASSGGDLRELLVSLATADVFRYRPKEDRDSF
jgi:hypothetical protein